MNLSTYCSIAIGSVLSSCMHVVSVPQNSPHEELPEVLVVTTVTTKCVNDPVFLTSDSGKAEFITTYSLSVVDTETPSLYRSLFCAASREDLPEVVGRMRHRSVLVEHRDQVCDLDLETGQIRPVLADFAASEIVKCTADAAYILAFDANRGSGSLHILRAGQTPSAVELNADVRIKWFLGSVGNGMWFVESSGRRALLLNDDGHVLNSIPLGNAFDWERSKCVFSWSGRLAAIGSRLQKVSDRRWRVAVLDMDSGAERYVGVHAFGESQANGAGSSGELGLLLKWLPSEQLVCFPLNEKDEFRFDFSSPSLITSFGVADDPGGLTREMEAMPMRRASPYFTWRGGTLRRVNNPDAIAGERAVPEHSLLPSASGRWMAVLVDPTQGHTADGLFLIDGLGQGSWTLSSERVLNAVWLHMTGPVAACFRDSE